MALNWRYKPQFKHKIPPRAVVTAYVLIGLAGPGRLAVVNPSRSDLTLPAKAMALLDRHGTLHL